MPKRIVTKAEREKRRAERRSAQIQAMFPEDASEDIDAFRNMLARKIHMLIGAHCQLWRGCPERACRRQRICLAPHIKCSNAPPKPPSTPEETARALAMVQRAIREFGERRGMEE